MFSTAEALEMCLCSTDWDEDVSVIDSNVKDTYNKGS